METRLLILVALMLSASVHAANYYITESGSGAKNGIDWNNAFQDLPETLQRGSIYYIADGTYGSYEFDDPASGTQFITVKKAIAADHGTDTGWQSGYGDGEAVFSSGDYAWLLAPGAKYYHIDGQTGSGKSGYGIRLYSTANRDSSTALVATDTSGLYADTGGHSNIIIEHVDFDWNNGKPAGGCAGAEAVALRAANPSSDIVISHCYIHHASGGAMYFDKGERYVINDSVFYDIGDETNGGDCPGSSGHAHWEIFWFTDIKDITFSNNILENAYPNGLTGWVMFGGTSDVKVYNNVFFCSQPCSPGGNGVIASWSAYSNNNIYIYHNTFVDLPGGHFLFEQGSGFYGRNNLYYNPDFNCGLPDQGYAACGGGQQCCGSNQQTGITSTVFASYAGDDFSLSKNTERGLYLGAPYNVDKKGNPRTNWDRGAYEFSSGVTPPCNPSWVCTAWSACDNGQQTRTCSDTNNCGTANGKPEISQSCASCIPAAEICGNGIDEDCDGTDLACAGSLLVNGNFESGFTNGIGNDWQIQSDGSIRFTATDDTGYQGSAQKIQASSPGDWGLFIFQKPQFVLGRTYVWTFWYKSDMQLFAEITDAQANNVLVRQDLLASSQWKQMSISFTYTDQAASQLRFSANKAGSFWIDEVVLAESCAAADSNCDSCISQSELMQFIQRWKSGQATLEQLIQAIKQWKEGCS